MSTKRPVIASSSTAGWSAAGIGPTFCSCYTASEMCVCVCLCVREGEGETEDERGGCILVLAAFFCLKAPEPDKLTTIHQGGCCYYYWKVCFFVCPLRRRLRVCSLLVPEVKGAAAILLAAFCYKVCMATAQNGNDSRQKATLGDESSRAWFDALRRCWLLNAQVSMWSLGIMGKG